MTGRPGPGPTVPVRWRELYLGATGRVGGRLEARWLVEEASGGTWPSVLDELVGARDAERFFSLVKRREAGEPIQYVLGHWAFRHLDLMVDGRVLVPRPETEVVVERALVELDRLGLASPLVVDLGTGSGAIGFAIASERKEVQLWASDVSEDALAVASANLAGLGSAVARRARLVQGSWWAAFPSHLQGSVDLAVANPPYVAESELASLPDEVSRWEPRQALIAGRRGLEAVEAVVAEAPQWLSARSALVVEIAPHQSVPARDLARRSGFADVAVHPDLTGRERVLVARR